jgi:archaellum component FlaC
MVKIKKTPSWRQPMEDRAVLRIIEKLEKIDERFDRVDEGMAELKIGQARLENGQARLERRLDRLEKRFGRMEVKVDAIAEQTAHLMEFETETRLRLDKLEAANPA